VLDYERSLLCNFKDFAGARGNRACELAWVGNPSVPWIGPVKIEGAEVKTTNAQKSPQYRAV